MKLNQKEIYQTLLRNGCNKDCEVKAAFLSLQHKKIISSFSDEFGDYTVNKVAFDEVLDNPSILSECEMEHE